MIHLICQDWLNTSGNHTGIMYLCKTLQERYPESYRMYCAPSFLPPLDKRHSSKVGKRWDFFLAKNKHQRYIKQLYKDIALNAREGDIVFLTEYMEEMYPMLSFAKKIKNNIPNVKLFSMVHLVPSKLSASYSDDKVFKQWTDSVDAIFTLGSSLTDYFVGREVAKSKIVTSFHYVDEYYIQQIKKHDDQSIRVIAMGAQMRNNKLLSKICKDNPDVNFTICQGLTDMSQFFKGCNNVTLVPFVPESELRDLMSNSDISLNCMEDTIGSNVIVTSLAMGLAMVCSDVGSIRDYCDNSNSIFCNNDNPVTFSNAIRTLNSDKNLLINMRKSAAKSALRLSIDNFHKQLQNYIRTES